MLKMSVYAPPKTPTPPIEQPNPDPAKKDDAVMASVLEDFKNEDITLRLNVVRRLNVISKALGPEKTRTELLPVLAGSQ